MSNPEIGMASLAAIFFLVCSGMWVPFALMLVSFVGMWAIKGSPVLAAKLLALTASDSLSSYFFGVVPLFVLMGYIVSVSGMGRDAFDLAHLMFRRFRGGLAVSTVGANAIFAAITGISIASAAVFTRIAVPEMVRHGYTAKFSAGVVAGSSVLGMLIPPSLLLILYGLLTEQSIGDLFIAGIIPGVLLAIVFSIGVVLMVKVWPGYTGLGNSDSDDSASSISTRIVLEKGLPICTLVAIVLGGMYAGVFTPVEAGATGCMAALLIGLFRRRLNWQDFKGALSDTGLVTAAVCFLIIAAQTYSRMLSLSGLPNEFVQFISLNDLSELTIILSYVAALVIMGAILDSSSIMLIMVPLMFPVMTGMDVNMIWFGIVTVLAVEIGLLTPPFGMSVFVIKSTLDDESVSLLDIFWAAAPFALMMLVVLGLVIAMPWLVTVLL